ncbi:MAG: DMT family transporter [Spirosomataceae bacterium]
MRLTYLKLIITIFFWGSNFAAGKIALQSFDPYSAALVRFSVGALLLMAMLYRANKGFPSINLREWGLALLAGFMGVFLYNVLFFSGIQHMPTIRASLIIAFSPIVISLMSSAFFDEKIGLIKWIGIVVSLAGALIVVCRGDFSVVFSSSAWGLGELLILVSVLAWTIYTLAGKVALRQIPALTLSAYSTVIGCVLLLGPALQHGLTTELSQASWKSIGAAVYMGATATALGFVWFYEAVRQLGASTTTAVGNLTPVFAVLIAVVFLGESLSLSTSIGGLLVIGGILLTNLQKVSVT